MATGTLLRRSGANPDRAALTSYVDGDSPATRYWPAPSVATVRFRPVCVSTTLTVTPGKTAPMESTTVPVMSPEVPTPCAWATLAANSKHTNVQASDFIGFPLRMYPHITALVLRIPQRSATPQSPMRPQP